MRLFATHFCFRLFFSLGFALTNTSKKCRLSVVLQFHSQVDIFEYVVHDFVCLSVIWALLLNVMTKVLSTYRTRCFDWILSVVKCILGLVLPPQQEITIVRATIGQFRLKAMKNFMLLFTRPLVYNFLPTDFRLLFIIRQSDVQIWPQLYF